MNFFDMSALLSSFVLVGCALPVLAAPAPLQPPERGFISTEPANTWEEGLICGNGTIGLNDLSRPLDETIIFTHERLFLPEGDPVLPPLMAPRL